jgi:hypothetical protein
VLVEKLIFALSVKDFYRLPHPVHTLIPNSVRVINNFVYHFYATYVPVKPQNETLYKLVMYNACYITCLSNSP